MKSWDAGLGHHISGVVTANATTGKDLYSPFGALIQPHQLISSINRGGGAAARQDPLETQTNQRLQSTKLVGCSVKGSMEDAISAIRDFHERATSHLVNHTIGLHNPEHEAIRPSFN